MIIYTGYYGGMSKYNYPNPINIAGWPPKDWSGLSASKFLAPKKEWFFDWKEKIGKEDNNSLIKEYCTKYAETVLSKFTAEELYDEIYKLSHHDCTLMCYEVSPENDLQKLENFIVGKDFCHRHLISRFLRNGGYESFEFTKRIY